MNAMRSSIISRALTSLLSCALVVAALQPAQASAQRGRAPAPAPSLAGDYLVLPEGLASGPPARANPLSLGGNFAAILAFDPNQGMGNFPGVVSITAGSSNIVITGGTGPNPSIDLGSSIALSSGTPLNLTGTTTNSIQSEGLTTSFNLTVPSGTALTALAVNPANAPTKLLDLQVGSSSKLSVDGSGDLTGVNGSFSGTLSVTGASTVAALTGTNATLSTAGTFLTASGTGAADVLSVAGGGASADAFQVNATNCSSVGGSNFLLNVEAAGVSEFSLSCSGGGTFNQGLTVNGALTISNTSSISIAKHINMNNSCAATSFGNRFACEVPIGTGVTSQALTWSGFSNSPVCTANAGTTSGTTWNPGGTYWTGKSSTGGTINFNNASPGTGVFFVDVICIGNQN